MSLSGSYTEDQVFLGTEVPMTSRDSASTDNAASTTLPSTGYYSVAESRLNQLTRIRAY